MFVRGKHRLVLWGHNQYCECFQISAATKSIKYYRFFKCLHVAEMFPSDFWRRLVCRGCHSSVIYVYIQTHLYVYICMYRICNNILITLSDSISVVLYLDIHPWQKYFFKIKSICMYICISACFLLQLTLIMNF